MSVSVKYYRGGGSMDDYSLTSPNNTIQVVDVKNGHEIEVDPQLMETINNKQDKMVVGGFQTNAIYSMSFIERDGGGGIPREVGHYVPLLEIQSFNNSKSQFEFSIFSREDSMNYYGRYLFSTSTSLQPKFELLDYCVDQNKNQIITDTYKWDSIVAFKIYNSAKYSRFLICKKIRSTDGNLDAYFFNILSQDIGFCYSKKYYSRNQQSYYTPWEFVNVTNNFTTWSWKYVDGIETAKAEYELPENVSTLHTVDLLQLTEIKPTPSIIKPLTIDDEPFYGVENRSIETKEMYTANGILGVDPNPYDIRRKIFCSIWKGTELAQYDWSELAFVNFSTIDNDKIYWVYEVYTESTYRTGYIIETPNNFN